MITFAELTQALDATGIPFKPYEWEGGSPATTAWGTVLIGSSAPEYGDNEVAEEYLTGTITLRTRVLDAAAFNAVTAALKRLMQNDAVFCYRMTGVRLDSDKQVLYYSWRWSGTGLDRFE